MASPYDSLAADYNALFGDVKSWAQRWYERFRQYLGPALAGARILDCACGTGAHAYALASHGHRVSAADASEGMLREARRLFQEAGLAVPTFRSLWRELPQHVEDPFDVVVCCGNSISHCPSGEAVAAAVAGMRAALRPGGYLLLDNRHWEKLLAERPRFQVGAPALHRGVRTLPIYFWSFAGWKRPVTAELLFVFEQPEAIAHRSYVLEMHPYRIEELRQRLSGSGFDEPELHFFEEGERYCLVARRR